MELFGKNPGFCPDCGSILPQLKPNGGVVCYSCARAFSAEVFAHSEIKYTVHFNTKDPKRLKEIKEDKSKDDEDEGPVVERKCPKCGNDKMSYATVQLRSADEGQTVFFTCTECKYKESENS